MNKKEVILKTALTSRATLFLIQYVSNIIIPDHEADAFLYPKSDRSGVLDELVEHLFGGFVKWDGQHFMHIATYGYTYEHNLAFFPLYPYLVRTIAVILSYAVPFLSFESLLLIVFVLVNGFCFVQSVLCLYELSLNFMTEDLAFKASVLFCFNPASVFFSALYTESLFSYLTFKSSLNCVLLYKKYCGIHEHLQVKDFFYVIPVCLSTCTRSNGVLNVGFLIYTLVCLFVDAVNRRKQTFGEICNFVILALLLVSFCMTPFVLFQIYCYCRFCTDFNVTLPLPVLNHKDIKTFVLPGTFSKHNQTWCFKQVPLAYSYIQSHYWKVGFLRYYEPKQIPNFLLASPIIVILLHGSCTFFKRFPKEFRTLFNFSRISQKPSARYHDCLFVFVLHCTALCVFCVLNAHVQVTTRMLCSASPALYWFCARYLSDLNASDIFRKLTRLGSYSAECFIFVYFLSYYVIGTIMFCNFLPWT